MLYFRRVLPLVLILLIWEYSAVLTASECKTTNYNLNLRIRYLFSAYFFDLKLIRMILNWMLRDSPRLTRHASETLPLARFVLYRTKNQKYLQIKTSEPTEYLIRMFKFYSKGFGEYPYPVRNWNVSGTHAHFSLFHLMSSYNDNHTVMIILCLGMKDCP